MLAFNHILAGSIIGLTVPPPLIAPTAFLAHFVMDLFPHAHGEEPPFSRMLKVQIGADVVLSLLSIAFVIWLFPDQLFFVGLGAFFCFLPDAFWLVWKRGGPQWFQKFLDWAHWIQWGERPYGWIFDAIYGLLLAITLYLLSTIS